MNYYTHEFNTGFKIISSSLMQEIISSIEKCNIKFRKGNIPVIRDTLHMNLMNLGWSPEVQIDPKSKISITSIKNNVGLCIQTGNIARMYADLLKLQTAFLKNIIKGAIFIVPMKNAGKILGDNIAHLERLTRELDIFGNVITIPLVIYGFHE